MKQYDLIHVHDDDSNSNMIEVVTKLKDYTNYIAENDTGIRNIAITNHGTITGWYNRKKHSEKVGMKYVHAVEGYVTMTLDEKVRDNFHITLFAKNTEGFKELNILTSNAYKRDDGHYYYNPRIEWKDIKNTSDNIIISTGCLGGMLWQLRDSESEFEEVLEFIKANKDRVYLEVQPHNIQDQKDLNKIVLSLAKDYDMNIIGGSDTHALDELHDKTRKVLQKSKGIEFSNEESFDLTLKTYDEMVQAFKVQGVLNDEQIETCLANTMKLTDSCEEIQLDYSKKYPKIYDGDSKSILKSKIKEGWKYRKMNEKLTDEEKVAYKKQINYELSVYETNGAIDYLLLEDMVKGFARGRGIKYGYGRGSATGSIICYLLRITELDSIKHGLNFERFMSKERISLADIDTDYEPSRRWEIQKFLYESDLFYAYPIMTNNTMDTKGAIKSLGKGMDYTPYETALISKMIDDGKEELAREEYPQLFEYVDIAKGVVVSVGQHACGFIVSPIPVDEHMGLITSKDSIYPLTALSMTEIDEQNFVKLDLLALDGIGIIAQTCRLANIDYIIPEDIDGNDEKVWQSIVEDNTGIFQLESDFAWQVFKDTFSKETLDRIRTRNPNVNYIDLLSLDNAIIRPSGASYRGDVVQGNYYDNGHKALNDFLESTLGRLVYQEQQIEFLVEFCGFTKGMADLVRRGIGKKKIEILESEVPKAKHNFINKMISDYDMTEDKAIEVAEPFFQVFMDSANYGFSVNHSESYSWIGFVMAYLRYYYPLEYCTAMLNQYKSQKKTARSILFAKSKGITINDIAFGYSSAIFEMNKETNSIYQGVSGVKFLNEEIATKMLEVSKGKEFDSFVDLLYFLTYDMEFEKNMTDFNDTDDKGERKLIAQRPKNKFPIDSRQIEILIKLKFFKQFGGNKKLLKVYSLFKENMKSTYVLATAIKKYMPLIEMEKEVENEDSIISQQCLYELEYLGSINTKDESISKKMYLVIDLVSTKSYNRITAYQYATGKTVEFKINKNVYVNAPVEIGNSFQLINVMLKPKRKLINGSWQEIDEKDIYIKEYRYLA